ncbi:hypothetical protein JXB22_02840 [candidate division WOR-3 bacterium]|nr:hypothetical protein [candidate division WOR-3 bacterium]
MLYDKGFYDEAITEYKRYIFFHPDGDLTSDAYYRIALAYRDKQNWQGSIEAFRMAMQTAHTDSLRHRAELALAVTYIASENYSAAEIVLLKLEMSMPPKHVKERAAFLRALATMYAKKWEHAQKAFEAYFLHHPDPGMQAKVDSLLHETKNFHYVSADSARQLSAIIPGLGQMYAGDWGNGLNALLLDGSMIGWMWYKVTHSYFGDAWTIYYFLFRRYYAGNMYNAQRIAEEHNDALDRKQTERILQLFLEE